jgi:transposase
MSMTSNSHPREQIEIITSVQRRRRWSSREKLEIVEESELPGISVSAVARKHGVSPSLLFTWRRLAREGKFSAIHAGEEVVAASEVRRLKAHVRELERILGKKTLENEILKDAVEIAREKKLISRVPLLPGEDIR